MDTKMKFEEEMKKIYLTAKRECNYNANRYIQMINEKDRGAIVDFDSSAKVLSGFTSDKATLSMAAGNIDSSGGTNLGAGISSAINLFSNENYEEEKALKCIIMLTDGDGSYSHSLTTSALNKNIIIYTVGLGNSVNSSLLQSIANGTGGSYHSASNANSLYKIFERIAEESDLGKDTDEDGIPDYYEKQMAAGNLRLGTGVPLLGMDYKNPDSDGDGLLDGDEIKITKGKRDGKDIIYVKMTSNPTMKDTDGDGIPDNEDLRPLVFDMKEAWIHRSTHREGVKKFEKYGSNKIADDLTFNDYSFLDLLKAAPILAKPLYLLTADTTPEARIWGEMYALFAVVGKRGAGEMAGVLDEMLDKFKEGSRTGESYNKNNNYTSGSYSYFRNSTLTKTVKNHKETQRYITQIIKYIVDEFKKKDIKADLRLFVFDPEKGDKGLGEGNKIRQYTDPRPGYSGVKYPSYGSSPITLLFEDGITRALGLAIRGWQGHEIYIKDFNANTKEFSGKLVFRFYDHFGLDKTDHIDAPGFCDWFVLQHYDKFNGKYAPFITEVEFEVDIKGEF